MVWNPARPAGKPAGITCPDNAVFASPIPCRPACAGGWIRPGQVISGSAAAMGTTVGVGTFGRYPDTSCRGRPGLVPSRPPPRVVRENPTGNYTDAMRCVAGNCLLTVVWKRRIRGICRQGARTLRHEPDSCGTTGLPKTWPNGGRKVRLTSGEGRGGTRREVNAGIRTGQTVGPSVRSAPRLPSISAMYTCGHPSGALGHYRPDHGRGQTIERGR